MESLLNMKGCPKANVYDFLHERVVFASRVLLSCMSTLVFVHEQKEEKDAKRNVLFDGESNGFSFFKSHLVNNETSFSKI